MSQTPTPEAPKAITPAAPRIPVTSDIAVMDTGKFDHMYRIAGAMSAASLIPEHLRGRRKSGNFDPFPPEEVKANCFLVVNQSLRWGMDPFAVMPETYVVGGKLAYQGKLVAAVVNSRAGLESRLRYTFSGTKGKDDFSVTVSGRFKGETEPCEVTLSVGQGKTDNQMWHKDPEQKLIYSGVVKWARRYCPEVVLGVMTDDDLEAIQPMKDADILEAAAKTPVNFGTPAQAKAAPAPAPAQTQSSTPAPASQPAQSAPAFEKSEAPTEKTPPKPVSANINEERVRLTGLVEKPYGKDHKDFGKNFDFCTFTRADGQTFSAGNTGDRMDPELIGSELVVAYKVTAGGNKIVRWAAASGEDAGLFGGNSNPQS